MKLRNEMREFGQLDMPRRFAPRVPIWVTEIACGLVATAAAALARTAVDALLPGAAPYIFLFPGVLIATGLGGWRAGVLALGFILALAWRRVLAPAGSSFANPADAATFALNALSALVVVMVAHGFRAASRREIDERSARLAQRDLLFRELNHRMKNSFAMISSVVDLQRRRAASDDIKSALGLVLNRMSSIARAHDELYGDQSDVTDIDFGAYLDSLCRDIGAALGPDAPLAVRCRCDSVRLGRDRAVAFGLIVNELATNAAKYATTSGAVTPFDVRLTSEGSVCTLLVADDGPGLPADYDKRTGLGRRLIEAFAQQAGATLTILDERGAQFRFVFTA